MMLIINITILDVSYHLRSLLNKHRKTDLTKRVNF